MRNLLPRTLTAIVFITAVLAVIYMAKTFDTLWILLLLVPITWWATMEYVTLINRLQTVNLEGASLTLLNVIYMSSVVLFQGEYALWTLTLAILWPVIWYSVNRMKFQNTLASWFGLLYIPMFFQFNFWVFAANDGGFFLIYLLASVWIYDIGAYLVGSFWGREKLIPEVSPKKTWEGVLGGSIGVLLINVTAPMWIPELDWSFRWVLMTLFLVISTQLGDLFESWLKRYVHVKDAGDLLPGHGGILDRIDGLLFAAPVFYFYMRYVLDLIQR